MAYKFCNLILFVTLLVLFSDAKKLLTRENKLANYDYIEDVSSTWTPAIAGGYRDLAGLGYITETSIESQLYLINSGATDSQTKQGISYLVYRLFKVLGWEHIKTVTGDESSDNFSYTIIRNLNSKKLVCTFSGTKSYDQLKSEFFNSGGDSYFREGKSSKVKIMKYFNQLYPKIEKVFTANFEKANDSRIKQFIFTGHSLGGAIASLALFDLVKQGKLKTNTVNKSPVLITFGQPRTGNYMFANEVSKMAPIIYRHVNDNDLIPGLPYCVSKNGACVNEFGKTKIDSKESKYKITDSSNKFFAWHLPGLILINGDGKDLKYESTDFLKECVNESENARSNCKYDTSLFGDFHKYYFGYKISELAKPEVFDFDIGNSTFQDAYPAKNIFQEKSDNSGSFQSIITGGLSKLLK
jgi:hypothetical protein